jgi:hypothetical protein
VDREWAALRSHEQCLAQKDGRQHRHYPPHIRANVRPLAACYGYSANAFCSYGADATTMWIARWRGFYLACAELFDYNGGNEWFVSHYLFRKRC